MKAFFGVGTYKGWKDCNRVTHNIYHVGYIEIYHHVILSIPEDSANNFAFLYFTALGPEVFIRFLDNDTTKRYKMYLNRLGLIKVESGGVNMMLKTGMEVAQYYTIFN